MSNVSVIVTVYNTEEYIKKCVDSLLAQSYKNIEILLIDGGSTDKTTEICSKYENKYENIRLIRKENEGVSAARNKGIDEASGNYILFVDGDDWIEDKTVQTLVWLLEENQADMSYIIKNGHMYSSGEVLIGNGQKMLLHILNTSSIEIWGKLFRKELFKNVRFPVGKENEDIYILPDILLECKKVVAYHKGLYHYTLRDNGLMSKVLKSDYYNMVECWNDGINKCGCLSNDKDFVRNMEKWYLYHALWYFYNRLCVMDENQYKLASKNISLFYKKTRWIFIKNTKVKIGDKFRFWVISVCPSIIKKYTLFRYGRE